MTKRLTHVPQVGIVPCLATATHVAVKGPQGQYGTPRKYSIYVAGPVTAGGAITLGEFVCVATGVKQATHLLQKL